MRETIIILHGWGLRGGKYINLQKLLENKGYKVYAPDLPGFGAEPIKNLHMNLDSYVEFVESFMEKNKIGKAVIVGHSFGGRVGIKFAWKNPDKVLKLILTGTPLQRDRSFSKKIAFVASKTGGKVLKLLPKGINNLARKSIYRTIGEWDYYKAGDLKEIFKNIIEEEPIKYFKELNVPVFLIWGKDDKTVPQEPIKQIAKISKAHFVSVPNTNHRLPYMNPDLFWQSLKKVL